MTASGTFSSARNVRSSTAPVRKFFSLVRTNAPPLPGFTCWNSTTVIRPSGRLRAMPFFRSLVEMLKKLLSGRPLHHGVLGELGQCLGAVGGDDEGVLDAHTTDPREVDAGLDGHHRTDLQRTRGRLRHPRRLVDLEADPVPGTVREALAPARRLDP